MAGRAAQLHEAEQAPAVPAFCPNGGGAIAVPRRRDLPVPTGNTISTAEK